MTTEDGAIYGALQLSPRDCLGVTGCSLFGGTVVNSVGQLFLETIHGQIKDCIGFHRTGVLWAMSQLAFPT